MVHILLGYIWIGLSQDLQKNNIRRDSPLEDKIVTKEPFPTVTFSIRKRFAEVGSLGMTENIMERLVLTSSTATSSTATDLQEKGFAEPVFVRIEEFLFKTFRREFTNPAPIESFMAATARAGLYLLSL